MFPDYERWYCQEDKTFQSHLKLCCNCQQNSKKTWHLVNETEKLILKFTGNGTGSQNSLHYRNWDHGALLQQHPCRSKNRAHREPQSAPQVTAFCQGIKLLNGDSTVSWTNGTGWVKIMCKRMQLNPLCQCTHRNRSMT